MQNTREQKGGKYLGREIFGVKRRSRVEKEKRENIWRWRNIWSTEGKKNRKEREEHLLNRTNI